MRYVCDTYLTVDRLTVFVDRSDLDQEDPLHLQHDTEDGDIGAHDIVVNGRVTDVRRWVGCVL